MNKPRMKKAKREKLAGKINARSQRRTRQAEDKQREARAGADHKNAAGRQAMKGRSTAKPKPDEPKCENCYEPILRLSTGVWIHQYSGDDQCNLYAEPMGDRKAGKR